MSMSPANLRYKQNNTEKASINEDKYTCTDTSCCQPQESPLPKDLKTPEKNPKVFSTLQVKSHLPEWHLVRCSLIVGSLLCTCPGSSCSSAISCSVLPVGVRVVCSCLTRSMFDRGWPCPFNIIGAPTTSCIPRAKTSFGSNQEGGL